MAGTVTRHMPVIDISVWALEIQRTDPFSSLVVYGFRLRPSSLSSSPSSSPPTPPCILPSAQPCRPKDTAWNLATLAGLSQSAYIFCKHSSCLSTPLSIAQHRTLEPRSRLVFNSLHSISTTRPPHPTPRIPQRNRVPICLLSSPFRLIHASHNHLRYPLHFRIPQNNRSIVSRSLLVSSRL
ncbi:hypothetical protein AcV5_006626 [Taiwanofungus camphoratus]|nr:hypothetical protein AcV5_006626 [Antrodia cinnamomea]KAI0949768.1 hypothetical protein AcV7_008438 [Antrodia cinnamomea]